MARHPLHNSRFLSAYRYGPGGFDPEHCQWAVVVGDRIRRLRVARGWTLKDLSLKIVRPDGYHYTIGYFSKLERGWASAPLYVYLSIAAAFDMDGGRLLGPDSAMLEASEAEMTVVQTMRELGIEPHAALAQLVQARDSPIRSSSPSIRVDSGAPAPS